MKTLDEHNKERENIIRETNSNKPVKNGIACPKCGSELVDSSPMTTLCSYPPQKNVRCDECGYTGYRVA